MIAGFPTETEEDHQDTLSLMEYVKYDFGFMFAYSERPGTLAGRKFEDDIPEEVLKTSIERNHSSTTETCFVSHPKSRG